LIQLSKTELRKLQLAELDILVELDRICRKNSIRYSLTGGTLLGAVRHGGFIPWDDDADVSMLRSEYEKFRLICMTDLDEEFYFQEMRDTEGYRWGYGKLRKRGTLFVREHQEHMPYEQGVFIDIFPRDGVPDGFVRRKVHKFRCFCMRKILWAEVGKYAHEKLYMRVWFRFLSWVTGKNIYKMYSRLVEESNRKNTNLVRNLTFPVPNKEDGYPRKWYEESVELEFEGHWFMVNKFYEAWLKQEFGDYMELPPPERRKIHPVVMFSLGDFLIRKQEQSHL